MYVYKKSLSTGCHQDIILHLLNESFLATTLAVINAATTTTATEATTVTSAAATTTTTTVEMVHYGLEQTRIET